MNFAVGTTLYTSSAMTTTIGAGFYRIYHILNDLERDCIIKVSASGVILTLNNYNPYCNAPEPSPTNPSNPSTGGGCVDPNTDILLPNGLTKLASDLVVGDFVYTLNEFTGEYNDYEVVFKDTIIEQKMKIIFTDNTSITTSISHKFLDLDLDWIEASVLRIGDIIKGKDSDKVISIIEYIGKGEVIRLQIQTAHTYIANGLIPHNKTIIVADPNSP